MIKINIKNAGFSLIELLFAMLFMSVIVFGVIKLQTSNLTLSNTKQFELRAHFIAAQGLEIVEALGHGAVDTAYMGNCTDPDICECEITGSGPYGFDCMGNPETLGDIGFSRSVIVEPEPEGQDLSDDYMVTTRVEWTDSSGDHSASVNRIIFN